MCATDARQQMVDETVYQQPTALLPEAYRSYYADLEQATTQYIRPLT